MHPDVMEYLRTYWGRHYDTSSLTAIDPAPSAGTTMGQMLMLAFGYETKPVWIARGSVVLALGLSLLISLARNSIRKSLQNKRNSGNVGEENPLRAE